MSDQGVMNTVTDKVASVGRATCDSLGYTGVALLLVVLIIVLLWLMWKTWGGAEGMSSGVSMMDGIYTSGMKGRWQAWRTDPVGNLSDLQSEPQGPIAPLRRDSMVGSRPGYYFGEPQVVARRAYRAGDWTPAGDRSVEGFNQNWFGKPSFSQKDRLSQTVEAASLHGR